MYVRRLPWKPFAAVGILGVAGWWLLPPLMRAVPAFAALKLQDKDSVSSVTSMFVGVASLVVALVGLLQQHRQTTNDAIPPRERQAADRLSEHLGRRERLSRMGDARTSALALRVHPAIDLPADPPASPRPWWRPHRPVARESALPAFIPREQEDVVRAWMRSARHEGGFLILMGNSCVGKTRLLYETARTELADFTVLVPDLGDGDLVNAIAGARSRLPKLIVWLDELQRFMPGPFLTDGSTPITPATVRHLLDSPTPVVVLGTLWPPHEATLRGDNSDQLRREELPARLNHPEAVDILNNPGVHEHRVDTFSTAERAEAKRRAADDPRLRAATADQHYNVTEALAGAREIMSRYQRATDDQRAVLHAAVDARRAGIESPLTEELLCAAAYGYLSGVRASDEWFRPALAELSSRNRPGDKATAPLLDQASDDQRTVLGYTVTDYLLQEVSLKREAEPLPEPVWRALIQLSPLEDLGRLAAYATARLLHDHADEIRRRLAEAGVTQAPALPEPVSGNRRRLLSIGVDHPEGQAKARTDALTRSFARLGYDARALDAALSADAIGEAVRSFLGSAESTDTLVLHVLGHGHTSPTGGLRLLDAVGQSSPSTEIDGWIRTVADAADGPPTLFLLDICTEGPARIPWRHNLTLNHGRAWVIAASALTQSGAVGRFTESVTEVTDALAAAELDIDSSYRHVPLGTVARQVRRSVVRSGDGLSIDLWSSLVELSETPPDLPFFPNVRYSENARSAVDAAVLPFWDDFDDGLDAAHFMAGASGYDADPVSFFGRRRELRILAPWMNLQDDFGLRVITGSPGVGKSALISVLVCAAHPRLRSQTRHIWEHVEQAPYLNRFLAAVHARNRGVAQIVASIAHQLDLPEDLSTSELIRQAAALAQPPVVVVDALDEAIEGEKIMQELLLPLAAASRSDGEPVRLLVGVRPWENFEPLLNAARAGGGLIDLDEVDLKQLRRDLAQYVTSQLLADLRWNREEFVGPAYALAHAVAERASGPDNRRVWGAFLLAGLFTSHILASYPEPIDDQAKARDLGASMPLTLPELLELDLNVRKLGTDVRAMLTALAYAKGEGMPVELLRYFPGHETTKDPLTPSHVLDMLGSVRFYLRRSLDPADGTALYRLFHQGMADYLRSTDPLKDSIIDGLLASVSTEGRARRWDLAPPYVLRHLADHAQEADRLDEIGSDPEFLAAGGRPASPADSRPSFVLALNALRSGASDTSWPESAEWRPLWIRDAAGGQRVTAVRLYMHHERTVAALGTEAGTITVVDFQTGSALWHTGDQHQTAVVALAVGPDMLVAAGLDHSLRFFDLESGDPTGENIDTDSPTLLLELQSIGGRPTVMTVDSAGQVHFYDVRDRSRSGGLTRRVLAADTLQLGNVEVWLSRNPDDRTSVLLNASGGAARPLRHRTEVTAASVGAHGAVPLAFTGDAEGEIRAWSVDTGDVVATVRCDSPIVALHADEHGNVLVLTAGEITGLAFQQSQPGAASSREIRRIISLAGAHESAPIWWVG